MTKKQITINIVNLLKNKYPNTQCSLVYDEPFKLLIAVRLSAQCTDKRVNEVCIELFKKYPTIESFVNSTSEDIENIIKPCGLHKQKSKDIIGCMQMLFTEFNSIVPDNMSDLLKLPGVGRKSANLILGDVYKKPAIVTDTHCIRITNRLGLSSTKDPLKTENELRKIVPPDESNDFCHRLVDFGRDICTARAPKCDICELKEYCKYYAKE